MKSKLGRLIPIFIKVFSLTLACLVTIKAQVPGLFNYQGRIAVGTVNFEGTGLFKFALVNGAGTTTYWSNDGTSSGGGQPSAAVTITVTKGLYSVQLGDTTLANMTTVPANVFGNADVRLRVWFNDGINGFQLLAPDQRIAAVGYAMVAGTVSDGAINSSKLASNLTLAGTTTGTFNGTFTGNVTGSAASFTGALAGDVTGTQSATSIPATVVTGKPLTNFMSGAGTITAADSILSAINKLNGNVALRAPLASPTFTGTVTASAFSGTLSGTASGFSGSLAGDVTGTQGATVVATVGGASAASVAAGAALANAGTAANTANAIVKRDGNGDFTTRTINLNAALNLPTTTTANVGVINQNGSRLMHSFGSGNFFAGSGTGNFAMTGPNNSATGYSAFYSNTSGTMNTAHGTLALALNTTGNGNTAMGTQALYSNVTGTNNVALGNAALMFNTSGSHNTGLGTQALSQNTTGSGNTASGAAALFANTSASGNTAVGYHALFSNTVGTPNTALGSEALSENVAGGNNTAVGFQALKSNTSGDNTGIGSRALNSNSSGQRNTAVGSDALKSNLNGTANTAVGYRALFLNSGSNVFQVVGGSFNTAIGDSCLLNITDGSYNLASGAMALESLANGDGNTALGYLALKNIGGNFESSADNNIAIGNMAGLMLSSGSNNIYVGNAGEVEENGVIRIGTPGTHSETYLAGVIRGNGSGITGVTGSTPTGGVIAFAGSTAPTGWLLCDGSAVSRTTYASLFAVIGTSHGSGNGTTTFNLPDYRGRFLRGVDGTAGNDTDKTSRTAMNTGGNTGNLVGSVQTDQFKAHNHIEGTAQGVGDPRNIYGATTTGSSVWADWGNSGMTAEHAYTSTVGGTETRPKNANVNYLIKD